MRSLVTAMVLTIALAPAAGAQQETPWVSEVGLPQYFAVIVADVDAAAEWYEKVFGLRVVDRTEAENGAFTILNLRNERLMVEIIRDNRSTEASRPRGFFKVGFQVASVAEVADRVEQETGERPRVVEMAAHGVEILQLRDPDGNTVQLFTPLDQ